MKASALTMKTNPSIEPTTIIILGERSHSKRNSRDKTGTLGIVTILTGKGRGMKDSLKTLAKKIPEMARMTLSQREKTLSSNSAKECLKIWLTILMLEKIRKIL